MELGDEASGEAAGPLRVQSRPSAAGATVLRPGASLRDQGRALCRGVASWGLE